MNGLMKDDVCKFVCVCFVFILYYLKNNNNNLI